MKIALLRVFCVVALMALPFGMASAQSDDPFEYGWNLDGDASELRFLSVKKSKVAETSSFATLSGRITEDGQAQVRVLLDSVDTKVDLRNVRMRFLFFETFRYPEAVITTQLSADQLTDLHITRRKEIELPYTLTLRGLTLERTADVAVTLIDNDRVVVSSITPIAYTLEELNLEEGRAKLETLGATCDGSTCIRSGTRDRFRGTVLGPEANRFHRDHFHFDTAEYRSGPYCR